MVAAPQILRSFITDALRMSAEAAESVRQLTEQAERKRISPAQVRALYRTVHTLKGTASMIPGGEEIAQALHQLEGKLATRSVLESARRYEEWLDLARDSVERAKRALVLLQKRERLALPDAILEQSSKGLVACTVVGGVEKRLWFPLASLTRVLSPVELAGRDVVCFQGAWIPVLVLDGIAPGREFHGLGVHTAAGHAVVAVREVLGVQSWAEAQKQGASQGMDLIGDAADDDKRDSEVAA